MCHPTCWTRQTLSVFSVQGESTMSNHPQSYAPPRGFKFGHRWLFGKTFYLQHENFLPNTADVQDLGNMTLRIVSLVGWLVGIHICCCACVCVPFVSGRLLV